jgi:hypothetical protein
VAGFWRPRCNWPAAHGTMHGPLWRPFFFSFFFLFACSLMLLAQLVLAAGLFFFLVFLPCLFVVPCPLRHGAARTGNCSPTTVLPDLAAAEPHQYERGTEHYFATACRPRVRPSPQQNMFRSRARQVMILAKAKPEVLTPAG